MHFVKRGFVIITGLVALFAVACESDNDKDSSGKNEKGLPQSIIDAKKLTVGSDIAYAPVEFFEEGTTNATGIDVDICAAIAKELNLSEGCEFVNTTFDGIIPALNAERFDIIMSALSDTEERQDQINFVDYFKAGTSILVAKGNPESIEDLDDLCGHTVGIQRGTTQEEVVNDQAGKCSDDNLGKLEVLTFETDVEAQQQLKAGRTVADLNDFPVAAYTAQTSGGGDDFEVVGDQIDAGPYGIGIRKGDRGLRDELEKAVQAIIDNGEYEKVLTKWDVTAGAVTKATINGG